MRERPYLLVSIIVALVAIAFVPVVVKVSTGRSSPPSGASAGPTGTLRPVFAALSCDVAAVAYINEVLGVSATTCRSYPIADSVMCQYSSNDSDPMSRLQATVSYLPDMTHEKFVEIRTNTESMTLPAGVTLPPGLPTSAEIVVTDYPGLGDEAYFTTFSFGGVSLFAQPTLVARQGSLEIQVQSAAPLDVEAGLIRELFAVLT